VNNMKFLALLSIIGVYFGALYYCGRGLDFSGGEDHIEDDDHDDDKRNLISNRIVTIDEERNFMDISNKDHWGH